MAPDDLGIVILPGEEIFPVAPWREAPNSWQAAAVDPHRGIIRHIPRRREKCWNQPVESLCRRGICLGDIDPIGRVRELKIVHRGGAKNLAQLGNSKATRLAPRVLDIGSPGISSPAGIAHGGRSKIPGVIRVFQHQGHGLGDIDVAAEAVFAEESRLLERFRPVGAATVVRRSRRKRRQEISVQDGGPCGALAPSRNHVNHTGS